MRVAGALHILSPGRLRLWQPFYLNEGGVKSCTPADIRQPLRGEYVDAVAVGGQFGPVQPGRHYAQLHRTVNAGDEGDGAAVVEYPNLVAILNTAFLSVSGIDLQEP